jgi:hypothetical protein
MSKSPSSGKRFESGLLPAVYSVSSLLDAPDHKIRPGPIHNHGVP